jgi:hypothetical protein
LITEKEVLRRDGKLANQGDRREDGVANLCPIPILKVFSFIQSDSSTIPDTPNPEKGHLLLIVVVIDLETNPQLNGCSGVEIFRRRIIAELGSCFVPVSNLDNDGWKMILRAWLIHQFVLAIWGRHIAGLKARVRLFCQVGEIEKT